MGTRASFFIGNPEDIENRQWLGCVAWDGYPDGDIGRFLEAATTEDDFAEAVSKIAASRDDYCDPKKYDFPFPWSDDLFLTDFTYAFFDEEVWATSFHTGWALLKEHLNADDEWHEMYSNREELPSNVQAPQKAGKPAGPDSIIIISA